MPQFQHQAYKRVDIETASQGKLILMLFDGAIKRTELAIKKLGSKKVDVVHNNLIRSQDIIAELRSALNMSAGEIAVNLDRIYEYIQHLLIMGNIRKKAEPLHEAIELMNILRDTWKELFESLPTTELPSAQPSFVQRGAVAVNVQG